MARPSRGQCARAVPTTLALFVTFALIAAACGGAASSQSPSPTILACGLSCGGPATPSAGATGTASSGSPAAGVSKPVAPGEVVVGLKPGSVGSSDLLSFATKLIGKRPTLVFNDVMQGFEATLTQSQIDSLRKSAAVSFIEQNYPIAPNDTRVPKPAPLSVESVGTPGASGSNYGSALARIEAENNPAFQAALKQPLNLGIAMIGAGIGPSADLNIYSGVNCLGTDASGNASCSTGNDADDAGIDTANAAVLAGKGTNGATVGIDPGAPLLSVKVLSNGSGTIAGIIAGLNWVVQQSNEIAVVYIDVGCQCQSTALDDAVNNVAARGVVVVGAVFDKSTDAKGDAPANNPNVIAVAAMADYDGLPGGKSQPSCSQYGADDSFASFSDYGSTVALAAPGTCLPTTLLSGSSGTVSGTNAAAALVAGAVALYLNADGKSLPLNAGRSAAVKNALIKSWAVPQSSKCGFSGGDSIEPMLLLAPCSLDNSWGTGGGSGGATASISGRVTSAATNQAVAGATVTVSGTSITATTASDGSFQLSNLPAGPVAVTVAATGFVTQSEQVTVSSGTATLNFAVQPSG